MTFGTLLYSLLKHPRMSCLFVLRVSIVDKRRLISRGEVGIHLDGCGNRYWSFCTLFSAHFPTTHT